MRLEMYLEAPSPHPADVPPLLGSRPIWSPIPMTHPRIPGHQPVEISAFFGICEFAWDPCFRANSAGVLHASALWGRSSL